MANKRLRKIIIDGREYLWKFASDYDNAYWNEAFTAYLVDYRLSPLIIRFHTIDDYLRGARLNSGLEITIGDAATAGVNLHYPKWAATLIHQGLEQGGTPNIQLQPFVIEDGLKLLAALQYTPTG